MAQDPQAGLEGSYDSCRAFLVKIQEFVKENTLSVMNMRFILSYYHGIVIPISTELSESRLLIACRADIPA